MQSLLFVIFLKLISEVNGGEDCIGKDGHLYYCNGFCCAGLGCCSYSNLWYVWVLLGLVILACLCGCASCNMRRYRLAHSAHQYRRRLSQSSGYGRMNRTNNRTTTTTTTRTNGRFTNSRYPRMTYNSVNEQGYTNRQFNELPPSYTAEIATAPPPPPYSEYCRN